MEEFNYDLHSQFHPDLLKLDGCWSFYLINKSDKRNFTDLL